VRVRVRVLERNSGGIWSEAIAVFAVVDSIMDPSPLSDSEPLSSALWPGESRGRKKLEQHHVGLVHAKGQWKNTSGGEKDFEMNDERAPEQLS
jgi:hypothetical protein